jgi:sulfur carrier protein ThiS
VPEGTTVVALLHRLGIPDRLPRLVLVNDRDAGPEHRLAAGDVVTVLPPLAGGAALP